MPGYLGVPPSRPPFPRRVTMLGLDPSVKKEAGDFGVLLARTSLGPEALNNDTVPVGRDGDAVRVAGGVVRHQLPLARIFFLTSEDK